MAAKSVIDIDINDADFKKFAAAFERYQTQVKTLPAQWAKQAKQASAAASTFTAMTAQLKLQEQIEHNRLQEQERQERKDKEAEKRRQSALTQANKGMTTLLATSKQITKQVGDTTASLLRWVGIGGLIGGLVGFGGGLLGLEGLARSAGDLRSQSMGLGVSPSQLQASKIGFGRYGDVPSMLEGIANAQALYQWTPFAALGLNPMGGDPAQMLGPLMQRARGLVQRPGGFMMAHTTGIDQILPMDTLRRLQHEDPQTFAEDMRQSKAVYDVQTKNLVLYQNLNLQLEKNKYQMMNALYPAFNALIPSVIKLSQAITDTIVRLINNGAMQLWIDKLGKGIEWLGNKISDKNFQQGVSTFMNDIPLLAAALDKWLINHGVLPDTRPYAPPSSPEGNKNPFAPRNLNQFKKDWDYNKDLVKKFKHKWWDTLDGLVPDAPVGAPMALGVLGLPALLASAAETAGFTKFFNKSGGGEGARGDFQWRGGRIKQFRKIEGVDPLQASHAQQADFVRWELQNTPWGRKTLKDMAKEVTTEGKLRAFIHDFLVPGPEGEKHDFDYAMRWLRHHPQQTTANVGLHISKAPGADVFVSTRQMATAG